VQINGSEVRSCGRFEDVSKLHAQWNNILLEVILGKIYKNVVINGVQIKYVTLLMGFKNKQRETRQ
jgi:hypothetical protein